MSPPLPPATSISPEHLARRIQEYYTQKPDFDTLEYQSRNRTAATATTDQEQELLKRFKDSLKMPVLPNQDNNDSNDKSFQDTTHRPSNDPAPEGGVKETVASMAHKANLGPVVHDDIGKPESKETLRARAEELNK